MPYNVHPDYVAILQKEFSAKHGRQSPLDFWTISEIVNETHAHSYTNFGGRMSEADQTTRNVAGMVARESPISRVSVAANSLHASRH